MTYEEAIYCLTVMRNEVLDTWEFDFSSEETDALGLALEAMELQVAKKPANMESVPYRSDEHWITLGLCPNCRQVVNTEHDVKRCCDCGQLLDWSE